MKPHQHMLRGLEMSGHNDKAIGTLLDGNGRVCAIGAYFLSRHKDAEKCGRDWHPMETKFCDAYGVGIAEANNGIGNDELDENGQRGLSIPTIAGMLKAIGL